MSSAWPVRWWAVGVVLGLMAAVVGLGGCGGLSAPQRAAVAKFSVAAADLGAVAAEEFRQSRRDVMEMNKARLALGDDSVDAERLDAYFTVEAVTARVQAAEALARYGELLHRLASGDDAGNVLAAGERLVQSLSSLRSAGRLEISDARLGAIGKAVAGIGQGAVEGMRARAVKDVAEASGAAVRRIAELIKRDFDPEGEHWSVGFEASAVRLEEQALNVRADLGEAPEPLTAEWVAAQGLLAEAEAVRGRSLSRFREVSGRIAVAADALVVAEKDLRVALAAGGLGLDDLDPFAEKVAELVRAYRVLRE